MNHVSKLAVKLEIESVKATPREGMTLDQLAVKMAEIGNEVLEINREKNYLLLKHHV